MCFQLKHTQLAVVHSCLLAGWQAANQNLFWTGVLTSSLPAEQTISAALFQVSCYCIEQWVRVTLAGEIAVWLPGLLSSRVFIVCLFIYFLQCTPYRTVCKALWILLFSPLHLYRSTHAPACWSSATVARCLFFWPSGENVDILYGGVFSYSFTFFLSSS